jgi:hypothetical protein
MKRWPKSPPRLAALVAFRIARIGELLGAGLARFLDVGGNGAGAEGGADHAAPLELGRARFHHAITAALVVV